jgi:uncharacterized membrane protein
MTMSVHQSEGWTTRLMGRLRQILLILAIALVVIAVLFLIVYGIGIHHHHSNTNHSAVTVFAPMLWTKEARAEEGSGPDTRPFLCV